MKKPFLEAGEIVAPFGVRGEVKLQPWCDSAAFLLPFKTLYIDEKPRAVASSRVHKGMLVLRFEGVEDMNAAEALRGKRVYFARVDAKLPPDRFFLDDILGAAVLDEKGERIGELTEVVELPSGRVYVVQGPDGEHSIPAVPEFILETNAEEGFLRVHMIEGM